MKLSSSLQVDDRIRTSNSRHYKTHLPTARHVLGGQSVIPLFGKAVIPKDWSKTGNSSSQRLDILHLAMDIDEFCPSPDQATIDRT